VDNNTLNLLSLAVQLPVVGVVVGVMIWLIRHHAQRDDKKDTFQAKENEKRDAALERVMESWKDSTHQRDLQWQRFFEERTEQHRLMFDAALEKLTVLSENVNRLSDRVVLSQRDKNSE